MLKSAAVLCLLTGIAHSYLGERYILIRLFRRDNLPHLFGNDFFTKNTLRFVWHIMTVFGWGFGLLLWEIGPELTISTPFILNTIGGVFLISGMFSFGFTRGQHLSWIVFWIIAALAFCSAYSV